MKKSCLWFVILRGAALLAFALASAIGTEAYSKTNHPYVSPLSTTDVSPDAPFGTTPLSPAGRVVGLAWEPPNTLYAATPRAGVWKSLSGGQNWFQSSVGLQFGIAGNDQDGKTYLAFDGADPQYPERLLYATIDDDGRVTPTLGGLWVSNDGAQSWQRVDLALKESSCTPGSLGISTVTFLQIPPQGAHVPLVMTSCGLFTTTDPSLHSNWQPLTPGVPFGGGSLLATDPRGTIFACQGSMVWESIDQGQSWVATQAPQKGTGDCLALAADPLNHGDGTRKVLETTRYAACPDPKKDPQAATCNFEVSVVTFANDGIPSHDQRDLLSFPGDAGQNCCGQIVLAASPHGPSGTDVPGLSYDVFASNRFRFWVLTNAPFDGAPSWRQVDERRPVHGDTWAFATTNHYAPQNGDCAVWLANDGGVYKNISDSPDGCFPNGPYVVAEHGLHLLTSTSLSGFSVLQGSCPNSKRPCPVLYVSSGDNDTWGLTPLSSIPGQWGPMGCTLGDSGSTFVTQVVGQMVTGREPAGQDPKDRHMSLFLSLLTPPIPGTLDDCSSGSPSIDISPPGTYFGGLEPPGNAGFAVVGDPSTSTNYYIGVDASAHPASGLTARAHRSGSFDTGWHVIDAGIFNCCDPNEGKAAKGDQVAAVKAGLAGSTLVIYVLTRSSGGGFDANGHSFIGGNVYRGELPVSELGTSFNMVLRDVSGDARETHLNFAADLFVNPYDPRNLYVFDSATDTHNIKVSFDAGQTWQVSRPLSDIATGYGTFRTACNDDPGLTVNPFDNGCTLRNMYFDVNPNIQVAVLQPGGIALSRDHGRHWADLDITHTSVGLQDLFDPEPLQIATGAFYDHNLNPLTHHPSLYLALGGAGAHRIDGPLETLGAVNNSIFCPLCANVLVIDDSHHKILGLHHFPDGVFRATQLLDLTGASTLRFHFVVDGQTTAAQTINLKMASNSGGVISVREECSKNVRNRYDDKDSGVRCRHTRKNGRGRD